MADKRTRGAPHGGTEIVWAPGLRVRWGISPQTLWRWRRAGKLPAPDIQIGDRVGWRIATIEALEQRGDIMSQTRTVDTSRLARARDVRRAVAALR